MQIQTILVGGGMVLTATLIAVAAWPSPTGSCPPLTMTAADLESTDQISLDELEVFEDTAAARSSCLLDKMNAHVFLNAPEPLDFFVMGLRAPFRTESTEELVHEASETLAAQNAAYRYRNSEQAHGTTAQR